MKKRILLSLTLVLGLTGLQAEDIASLYVNVKPSDARIRIMNIAPKFYNGIQLQKGKKYHLLINKKGYFTINKWFILNKDKNFNFKLQKNKKKALMCLQTYYDVYTFEYDKMKHKNSSPLSILHIRTGCKGIASLNQDYQGHYMACQIGGTQAITRHKKLSCENFSKRFDANVLRGRR